MPTECIHCQTRTANRGGILCVRCHDGFKYRRAKNAKRVAKQSLGHRVGKAGVQFGWSGWGAYEQTTLEDEIAVVTEILK